MFRRQVRPSPPSLSETHPVQKTLHLSVQGKVNRTRVSCLGQRGAFDLGHKKGVKIQTNLLWFSNFRIVCASQENCCFSPDGPWVAGWTSPRGGTRVQPSDSNPRPDLGMRSGKLNAFDPNSLNRKKRFCQNLLGSIEKYLRTCTCKLQPVSVTFSPSPRTTKPEPEELAFRVLVIDSLHHINRDSLNG